jgi:RimJ/RimL family protein N-acetyltransferase
VASELADIWPFFGLGIRTPMLEMRLPSDEEIVQLVRLIGDGVHAPEHRDIAFPWELKESPERERSAMQHHWNLRSSWSPDDWCLSLAVFVDGVPIGCQDVSARKLAVRRSVATGSWLAAAYHGRGIGTEMRDAVTHFAFAGLGASRAVTSFLDGNEPSRRVSQKLGYVANGDRVHDNAGTPVIEYLLKLDRDTWEQRRRDDIEIVGLEPCLELLGVDA